jgi:hypothetical protein
MINLDHRMGSVNPDKFIVYIITYTHTINTVTFI